MSIGGINFCDYCGEPVLPYDVAPVKIEEDGHVRQLHFHNRHSEDCLALQLAVMQETVSVA